MKHIHDLTILKRILERGLCHGVGNGTDTFCAEQAVAAVCGIPITDRPDECVTPAVSSFGRTLNDSSWSSDSTRASGMRDFLIAQIGSKDVVDGGEFSRRLALRTIQEVLPVALRAAKLDAKIVDACVGAKTLEEGKDAAADAAYAAYVARAADAVDAAYAAYPAYTTYAADAARAARAADAAARAAYAARGARAADAAARAAYAARAARAADAAARAAYAAAGARAADVADAAAYAADAAYAAKRDEVLALSARIATEILKDLKSPGAELLQ